MAALSKVFRKASLGLNEGTILITSKVCCFQYLLVFCLISGYTGERLIPGLRRKDWILRALLLAVTSLWPHKVGSRDEIYSASWKLMLISDHAKDLVKNCLEGGGCMSPFQPLILSGILNKSSVSESRKVACDNLCGESESFTE